MPPLSEGIVISFERGTDSELDGFGSGRFGSGIFSGEDSKARYSRLHLMIAKFSPSRVNARRELSWQIIPSRTFKYSVSSIPEELTENSRSAAFAADDADSASSSKIIMHATLSQILTAPVPTHPRSPGG